MQKFIQIPLWGFTVFCLAVLFFIIVYVLKNGLPVISWEFLFSVPKNMGKSGGILPMVLGTIYVTVVAVLIATPLGVGTAVYLTEYTRENKLTAFIRFTTECLAGIPSIIFGLFGFILFVIYFNWGWSILSGGLTLAIMILPTVIRTSEEAIRSVPFKLREVSFSLGANRWSTVSKVVIPSALPGILTGIILGVGRSISETAAVIFTAGSSLLIPTSIFSPARTMSVHFYILAREGISMKMAYGTAAVLIIAILIINFVSYWIMHKYLSRLS
ncbi:MAG: phosphate ABC transporter permease PstA [Armatimonadota bacterium]